MSDVNEHTSDASPAGAAAYLKPWVSPRRKRFWALIAVLAYTLAGFFLLPWWIGSTLVDTLREQTGHEATIERVQANPYTLSVDIEGFALTDPDGTSWLRFDLLRVNFQVSSLFRWAWSFDELRLDGLDWLFERFESGETRLGRLLASRAPGDEPADPFSLPRLLVYDLDVNEGRVRFRDDVPDEPISLEFGPISVAIQELSTLAEREGDATVRVALPGGATASWDGTAHLAPPNVSGSFRVDNADMSPLLPYLRNTLPLTAFEARLSIASDYRVSWPIGQTPDLALSDLALALAEVSVGGPETDVRFLEVAEARLSGGVLRYPERSLAFDGAGIDGLDARAWLADDGTLNLAAILPEAGVETADAPDTGGDDQPWTVSIREFTLSGSRVGFEDRRLEPPFAAELTDIGVTVGSISNQPGAEFPTSGEAVLATGGALDFEGQLQALPEFAFDGRVGVSGLPLALLQPYVSRQARIQVGDGVLGTDFELATEPAGAVTASGDITVDSLSIGDARDGTELLRWSRMHVQQFEADTATADFTLSRIELEQPYGRLVINEDMTTNWTGIVVDAGEAAAGTAGEGGHGAEDDEGAPESGAGWSARIDRIGVSEGSVDFADLSLPLAFSTGIREVGGRVTTLDTESVEPGEIQLEGKVDEYGLARASGTIVALDPLRNTDVQVEFRNLRMAHLSPYTVAFAGRRIAEGKLDLDLRYRIEDTRLRASNDIVVSDLVLGDKVEHPGAASLPLGLAVALLKDANGVIDIEIPIEGDVDDPQFDIGGVIWKAFTGLITKVVTAPFRLLGGLVGAADRDLGNFEFLAGRADLTPPEREKVVQLKDALQQRPQLTVVVPGAYAAAVDTPALRFESLRNTVIDRLGRDGAVAETREAMLDVGVRDVLEQLHRERFPDVSLESLREPYWQPPADEPEAEPVFDELAYAADLRDRLLASEEIGRAELEALAQRRAETIRRALLEDGMLDETRVELAPPVEGESEDGDWVILELEADAG